MCVFISFVRPSEARRTKHAVQEGVHIQDRGNVAMPVDMVKILKTQDENYVRTMRSSNAKVSSVCVWREGGNLKCFLLAEN